MSTNTEIKPAQKAPAALTRWVNWAAALVWVILLVFLAQNAIASQAEMEPRASMLFWASFAVMLIGGAIIGGMRLVRHPKA